MSRVFERLCDMALGSVRVEESSLRWLVIWFNANVLAAWKLALLGKNLSPGGKSSPAGRVIASFTMRRSVEP